MLLDSVGISHLRDNFPVPANFIRKLTIFPLLVFLVGFSWVLSQLQLLNAFDLDAWRSGAGRVLETGNA